MLAAVAGGAPDAGAVFARSQAREIRPYLGDTTCFAVLDRLAQGARPLLRLDPAGRAAVRTTAVQLTEIGARVLEGEADHVTLNDIDRWIGGVHLRGRQVPWRWDDGIEALVRR